jgi:hypothetical protein
MSAFRYISVASIGCLVYTAVVLIIEAPSFYDKYANLPDKEIKAFIFNLDLPTGFCMCFFAF